MPMCHQVPDLGGQISPTVGFKFSRMPSSALSPFLGGLGSLINPFKQKRAPIFKPRLLGSLVVEWDWLTIGFDSLGAPTCEPCNVYMLPSLGSRGSNLGDQMNLNIGGVM